MTHILRSSLSLNECKRRINSRVGEDRLFAHARSGKDFLGRIEGNHFRLCVRQTGRNSFAPVFYGDFSKSDTGETVITGHFQLHQAVILVFGLIFAVLILFAIVTGMPEKQILEILIGMLLLIGVAWIGLWSSRHEEEKILLFLQKTLNATTEDEIDQ